jgi:phage terminase large subunit-like protein
VIACQDGKNRWHVRSLFWTPLDTLKDRAKRDRAPYDVWHNTGYLNAIPGKSIDYEVVLRDLLAELEGMSLAALAFDRWRIDVFKREMQRLSVEFNLVPFGQGYASMAPAVDAVENALLNEQINHGGHPVLTMCIANSRITKNPAGDRKMDKAKATGRIDGAVALLMAIGTGVRVQDPDGDLSGFLSNPVVV